MEERINLIKEKLSGNHEQDLEILKAFYEEQNRVLVDTQTTIEAIEAVYNELLNETEEKELEETEDEVVQEVATEDVSQEYDEINAMIDTLIENISNESVDEALENVEAIIPRIEAMSKSEDDSVIHCSFSSDFEKSIFMEVFAGDKEVVDTPYANDMLYVIYSDLLVQKRRKKTAMEALDRAIYWNFLNRDARAKKIDLYLENQEIVKCFEALSVLQKISYTAEGLADCYNRYAYVFHSLDEHKTAYALYRLSYRYFPNKDIAVLINEYEKLNEAFAELTEDDIDAIAIENEIAIGPNTNIIKAHRTITTNLVNMGAIEQAKVMLSNDYSMTRSDEIADMYDQLDQMNNLIQNEEITQEQEELEDHQEDETSNEDAEEVVEEAPKSKKASTTKKSATTKKATTKKTTKKASEEK